MAAPSRALLERTTAVVAVVGAERAVGLAVKPDARELAASGKSNSAPRPPRARPPRINGLGVVALDGRSGCASGGGAV